MLSFYLQSYDLMKINDFDYFYSSICDLLDQLEIPKCLYEIGVEKNSAERLAEKALKDSAFATNPKSASLEQIRDLIEISLHSGR